MADDHPITQGEYRLRPDGLCFLVQEIFQDGRVGGDLLAYPGALVPTDWIEAPAAEVATWRRLSAIEVDQLKAAGGATNPGA